MLEASSRPIGAGASDGVLLACPEGSNAIAGGFFADAFGIVLAGSYPDPADPEVWVIEVISLIDTATNWIPNVTCA